MNKDQSTKTKDRSFEKFSGGCVERVTPVPIPNTEVKPLGADGTARATAWESRKPPGLLMKARERNLAGFSDRKSTRLHSCHVNISYAGLCWTKERSDA